MRLFLIPLMLMAINIADVEAQTTNVESMSLWIQSPALGNLNDLLFHAQAPNPQECNKVCNLAIRCRKQRDHYNSTGLNSTANRFEDCRYQYCRALIACIGIHIPSCQACD